MPVLEAGLVGIPAFCSNIGGEEIVGQGVIRFSPEADPDQVASLIAIWMKLRSVLHPRRHIRRDLTWHSIFQREILPLLDHGGVSWSSTTKWIRESKRLWLFLDYDGTLMDQIVHRVRYTKIRPACAGCDQTSMGIGR